MALRACACDVEIGVEDRAEFKLSEEAAASFDVFQVRGGGGRGRYVLLVCVCVCVWCEGEGCVWGVCAT